MLFFGSKIFNFQNDSIKYSKNLKTPRQISQAIAFLIQLHFQ